MKIYSCLIPILRNQVFQIFEIFTIIVKAPYEPDSILFFISLLFFLPSGNAFTNELKSKLLTLEPTTYCNFLFRTKLFIRSPNTLFKTEDAFQARKHAIATLIQKMWRGRQQRLAYLKLREAAISIERIVRGFLARKQAEKRRRAITTIRRFLSSLFSFDRLLCNGYGPEKKLKCVPFNVKLERRCRP